MGFKWSVVIAQKLMSFLVSQVLADVHSEVYIDNVLFVGSFAQVELARKQFIEICQRYNVTIGTFGLVAQTAEYRGINFDFKMKQFSLATSFIDKFRHRVSVAQQTWCDYRALAYFDKPHFHFSSPQVSWTSQQHKPQITSATLGFS